MHQIQTAVGIILFGLAIAGLLLLYRRPLARRVLSGGVTLMRHRYCLLLCFAPGALGVASLYYPYMLSAVLFVRNGYSDIAVITIICFFTVGVGLAEMQLIKLHGDLRFADRKFLLIDLPDHRMQFAAGQLPAAARITIGRGWSAKKIVIWFLLSLVLPACCLYSNAEHLRVLLIGTVIGIAIAMLTAMVVALLQRWILGDIDSTAASGILPFEIETDSPLQPLPLMKPISKWLFGTPGRGFSWLLDGPGYTDPSSRILLAGQAQNIILLAFSAVVFLANYVYVMAWDTGWQDLKWPTAFFGVLLLFVIGYLMCGLAYWLDRYGLPPVVFAIVYVVGCFWFGASDHYFEVDVKPRRLQELKAVSDKTNNFVTAASGPRLDESDFKQIYWADVLAKREIPTVNGEKTLIVVTASGGGIQAAAWTAKVLTELDHAMPQFAKSIGMISSVSGGSVGAMHYVGHRGDFSQPLRNDAVQDIETAARMHSLEAVSWGLAFPDFVRSVAPPAAPPLIDRGWALEAWWWKQMGRAKADDRLAMKELTIRDLIPLVKQGTIPPIVFNSTCVETGQRVLISPLHVKVAEDNELMEWDLVQNGNTPQERNDQLKTSKTQLVSRPLDFLDFYDACLYGYQRQHPDAWTRSNVRVSTAARLSATFSYVTPVARPCPRQDFGIAAWVSRMVSHPTDLESRLNLHFCDGGYADNPGLVTAIRAIDALLKYYEDREGEPPFDRILIVRIEAFPETRADSARDRSGYESAVYGPTAALHNSRVSTQAERGDLELRLLQRNTPEFFRKYAVAKDLASVPSKEPKERSQSRVSEFLRMNGVAREEVAEAINNTRESIKLMKKRYEEESPSPDKNVQKAPVRKIPVRSVQFRFRPDENSDPKSKSPPLTWTLTDKQSKDIDHAWDRLMSDPQLQAVDESEKQYTLSPSEMYDFFSAK